MSEYYNMNRGLNYIKKHYNNSDQNELGEYVTELIDMIEAKDSIIEKKDKKIDEALLWIVGITTNDDNAREILTEALKLTEE